MMKLMKYELLRRKSLLLGTAISILFAEGIVIYSLYRGGNWNVLVIVLTVLIGGVGILLPFFDTVTRLFSDFKQKHGYMLFLTPQNGYRIIWSKTLFGILEILVATVLIAGCFVLSATVADHLNNGVVTNFIASLEINIGTLIGTAGLGFFQLLAQLSIAVLAVVVSRVMVKGTSYNWLIALAMYFALAIAVNTVDSALLLAFGVVGDIVQIEATANVGGIIAKYFAIGGVTYTLWFFACTFVSGRLVKRGIDL